MHVAVSIYLATNCFPPLCLATASPVWPVCNRGIEIYGMAHYDLRAANLPRVGFMQWRSF